MRPKPIKGKHRGQSIIDYLKKEIAWSLCLAYVLCTIVTCQTCSTIASLNTLTKCYQNAAQTVMTAKQMEETQIEACFTTNQCQIPEEHKEWGQGTAAVNQTRQCHEAVFQQVHSNVTSCIQRTTGLTILTGSPHHGGSGGGGHEKFERPNPTEMANRINKACVNSTVANAAANTIQCLNTTFESGQGNLQQFCAARNVCKEAFAAAGCTVTDKQEARKEVENAFQTCIESVATPAQVQQLTADAPQCAGITLSAPNNEHERNDEMMKGVRNVEQDLEDVMCAMFEHEGGRRGEHGFEHRKK